MQPLTPKEEATANVLLEEHTELCTNQVAKKACIDWHTAKKYLEKMFKTKLIAKILHGKRNYWRIYTKKDILKDQTVCISLSALFKRGWTSNIITETKLRSVTHNEMQVYLLWQVEYIENGKLFKKLKAQQLINERTKVDNTAKEYTRKLETRANTSNKIDVTIEEPIEITKCIDFVDAITNFKIKVIHVSNKKLEKSIIEYHKRKRCGAGYWFDKINHIRHTYTNYDKLINRLRSNFNGDIDGEVQLLRKRVNMCICKVYGCMPPKAIASKIL